MRHDYFILSRTLQGYYEDLFTAADPTRSGKLNGKKAVEFFSRSKLPVGILKNIWTMADQNPKTNSLDSKKFYVAVRLIQIYQNGRTALGPDLKVNDRVNIRPPYFEGVTGVTVQHFAGVPSPDPTAANLILREPQIEQRQVGTIQPLMQQQYPLLALAVQDPYTIDPVEQGRYESLFPQYETDGFVYGKEAKELFSKSGLDNHTLRDIWNMVDAPVDNRLSKIEFVIAMHLIVCISKKNLPLPLVLPCSLKALTYNEDTVVTSQTSTISVSKTVPTLFVPDETHHKIDFGGAPGVMNPTGQPLIQNQESVGGGEIIIGGGINNMSISNAFDHLSPHSDVAGDSFSAKHSEVGEQNQNESMPTSTVSVNLMPVNNPTPEVTILNNSFDRNNASDAFLSQNQPSVQCASVTPMHMRIESLTAAQDTCGSKEELKRLQTFLQQIQAENVSLKAQIRQFSDEESHVRKQIDETVTEIVKLYQELTGLRNDVVEANTSLVEATSELKAQMEKMQILYDTINEVKSTKCTIDTVTRNVQNIQDSAEKQRHNQVSVTVSDSQFESNLFGLDSSPNLSKSNEQQVSDKHEYINVNDGYYGVKPTHPNRNFIGTNRNDATVLHSLEASMTPMGGASYVYEHVKPAKLSSKSQAELDLLKNVVYKADTAARSVEAQAQTHALQLDYLRDEADKAEQIAQEKQSIASTSQKKGFWGRSSLNKSSKKIANNAFQLAVEKRRKVQNAQLDFSSSQAEVIRLKREANSLRQQAEEVDVNYSSTDVNHQVVQCYQMSTSKLPYREYCDPIPSGVLPQIKPLNEPLPSLPMKYSGFSDTSAVPAVAKQRDCGEQGLSSMNVENPLIIDSVPPIPMHSLGYTSNMSPYVSINSIDSGEYGVTNVLESTTLAASKAAHVFPDINRPSGSDAEDYCIPDSHEGL